MFVVYLYNIKQLFSLCSLCITLTCQLIVVCECFVLKVETCQNMAFTASSRCSNTILQEDKIIMGVSVDN